MREYSPDGAMMSHGLTQGYATRRIRAEWSTSHAFSFIIIDLADDVITLV